MGEGTERLNTERADPDSDSECRVSAGESKVLPRRRPRRWRDVNLSDAASPTPRSEMFVWTRAMNPGLLKEGWRDRRWRPAAPIIICGFGARSTDLQ